jgi:hypothetical protein
MAAAIVYRFHIALRVRRAQARSLIAIDADRSQIHSAQREELADLEVGDVLGKDFIAEISLA